MNVSIFKFSLIRRSGINLSTLHVKDFSACKYLSQTFPFRQSHNFSRPEVISDLYIFKRLISSKRTAFISHCIHHVICIRQTFGSGQSYGSLTSDSRITDPGYTHLIVRITPSVK